MGLGYELLGFESVKDYGQALKGIPKNGVKRVFQRQSAGKADCNSIWQTQRIAVFGLRPERVSAGRS